MRDGSITPDSGSQATTIVRRAIVDTPSAPREVAIADDDDRDRPPSRFGEVDEWPPHFGAARLGIP
jgi:hypothetical protein